MRKLQIFLLINFPISNSFFINSIKTVSAGEDTTWNCCFEMEDGSICQDISSDNPELCAVEPLPISCDDSSDCARGCCVDTEEGLCTTNSIALKCEGGEFYKNNENCDIAECEKGCCILGKEVEFVTEKRCELLSLQKGFEKDWSAGTELDCLILSASQKEGACVLQGTCVRKTEKECLSEKGDFYEGYLCSSSELSKYNCTRQNSVGCVNGTDEIYWFDSCGNKENIYSSDRDSSWNNGKILSKDDSCNSGSSNINSETCGNCYRALSSVCSKTKFGETSIKDGNFVCKSLKCIDENGDIRENGESWCVYDSYIGDGKDTVGSRHWKRMCVEGEVIVEPCADYRGEICTQSEIEEDGETFTIANCVPNQATECLGYNKLDEKEKKCKNNEQCMFEEIYVDKYFKFGVCVPKYPKGFDLIGEEGNSEMCSIATQTCKIVYQKDWKGHWDCKANCKCNTAEFAEKMNDLCISIGDCGSYINYIGDGTNNIQLSPPLKTCLKYECSEYQCNLWETFEEWKERTGSYGEYEHNVNDYEKEKKCLEQGICLLRECVEWKETIPTWEDYTKYAKPVEGQYANPQKLNTSLNALESVFEPPEPEESDIDNALKGLGKISGATGTLVPADSTAAGATNVLGAVGYAAAGAAIGIMLGAYLAKSLKITGPAATVMMLAGGTAGAFAGLYAAKAITLSTAGWGVGIAVLVILYIWLIGWGKTKIKEVKFTCMAWEAPTGGENCEKCNEDPLKPCSEYRCSSLGQTCKLINKDTENPICESIASETNPPIISPGEVLTEKHEFQDKEAKKVKIRKENGDCVEENENITFTLITDEFAQCKYDVENKDTYESLEYYPLEQNKYTKEHTFEVKELLSLDNPGVYDITGDIKDSFGKLNLYVRCQDYHGNFNLNPYIVDFCIHKGPDTTAPMITSYSPKKGTFLKYGIEEEKLIAYVNEPAECRYDTKKEIDYEKMEFKMDCNVELERPGILGWPCGATLTDLEKGENIFYIKCKDKPWIKTEEDIEEYGERNVNSEDFVYNLFVTETELKIDSIKFKFGENYFQSGETIKSSSESASVDLEVKTSGGAENGKAICFWKWKGAEYQFYPDTNSNSHKQEGINLMRGKNEIPIRCEDTAENIVKENSTINIEVDSSPPIVVRVYQKGNYLKLITNEKAECYYDNKSCDFDIENAIDMTTALSTIHSAEWNSRITYHIKCVDAYGNENTDCAIKVKPEEK